MIGMRRVAGALTGLVLAVTLTACGGGGSPHGNLSSASQPPPVSSSVVPTPTPTPTVAPARLYPVDVPLTGHNLKPGEKPPLYPAAAKVKTQAGANAFAEFFMKTVDWGYATTNPAYLLAYSGRSCGLCAGIAGDMRLTAADHHWYLGGRLTVGPASTAAIAPVTAPTDFCSQVPANLSATTVVDKTGKVFNGAGAYRGDRFKVCVKLSSGGWQVSYLARLT